MNWNDIGTFLISSALITGAIVYIGKRIVDKSLDIALEKYKSTLALELETHKIKFGKLHQDRLDVIKLFHTKLYDLQKALYSLTAFMREDEKDNRREVKVNNELNSLSELLELNQIYFNENICKRIEEIVSEGHRILAEMINISNAEKEILKKEEEIDRELKLIPNSPTFNTMSMDEALAPLNKLLGEDSAAPFIFWIKLKDDVEIKIREARSEMTNEFRKLIGVD